MHAYPTTLPLLRMSPSRSGLAHSRVLRARLSRCVESHLNCVDYFVSNTVGDPEIRPLCNVSSGRLVLGAGRVFHEYKDVGLELPEYAVGLDNQVSGIREGERRCPGHQYR